VHATPHLPTDVRALGADLYATSAYKWYGPHIGCTVGDPALLETLRPDKLLPSSDAVPDRFEHGTSSFASYAGVTAAVDWIASHGTGGTRRERVLDAMATHLGVRGAGLRAAARGLAARDDVTLVGAPPRARRRWRSRSRGARPLQVSADLGNQGSRCGRATTTPSS
jgi:selenocysteine lyase/cysteine desulfurase